ncbi:hypothetical protein T492DRAFT_885393 [Pavlovales sp. CCMP2436]|nr:hypothetical protein T492DRAFT_885393 [Pavlovales sp. CCMP2436]
MSDRFASGAALTSGAASSDRARRLTAAREADMAVFAARKRALEDETARGGLKSNADKFDSTLSTDDRLTQATVGLVSKADYGRLRREFLSEDAAAAPVAAPAAEAETERQRAAQKRKVGREQQRAKAKQRAALSFEEEDEEGRGEAPPEDAGDPFRSFQVDDDIEDTCGSIALLARYALAVAHGCSPLTLAAGGLGTL